MATIELLADASVVYEKIKENGQWVIRNVWIREVDVEGKRVCASYDHSHYQWYFENTYRHWRVRYPRIGSTD